MSFGQRVKQYREAKGYTQEQLAQLIGVAKTTITGYERGNRAPDVEKIKKLAIALGVTGDDLLDTGLSAEAEIEPTEEEIRQRIDLALNRLTLGGKKKVAEYAEDLVEPRYREMTQEELRELYGRGPRRTAAQKPPAPSDAPETPPEGE